MAEKDSSLVAVTPAMSCGSCLDDFMNKYPERCLDVGIAEGHCVTYCGGITYGKKIKVVASIYSTFLQRAFDNLFHDVCLQEIPSGLLLSTAQASPDPMVPLTTASMISPSSTPCPTWLLPSLAMAMCSKNSWNPVLAGTAPQLSGIPTWRLKSPDLPILRRELGKGELLAEGEGLLLIGLGHMSNTALQVRELLLQKGVQATVLDPVFIKPLDSELICRLLVTHQSIVTIEEHSVQSGLGAILNHFLMSQGYSNIQVLNFGVPEAFIEQGTHSQLIQELGLKPEQIAQRICQQFRLQEIPSIQLTEEGVAKV